MRAKWLWVGLVAALPWVLGGSCADADRYRNKQNLLGIVELGPFPKQARGVGGYNLYISDKPKGPFERINDQSVLGYSRLMVPYLNPGQTYYFRMTSVYQKDPSRETAPGAVFARKAIQKAP